VRSQALRTDELRAAFRAELDDHTRSFNLLLMRIEREMSEDGRGDALNALYREAHSLKAAAICAEFGLIERLADALQSVFAVRRDGGQPDGAWFDAVYQAIDALAPLHRESVAGQVSPPPELLSALAALEIINPRSVKDDTRASRLLPVTSLLAPLDRVVRNVARESGKEVQLVLDGGEIEVDREILKRLRGPLVHIVRNAVDHGIEPSDVREQLGKSKRGTIRISASRRGSTLRVAVEDDGAGLDPARLRQAAADGGLLPTEQAMALNDQAAIELIFQPGFTTARTVTITSGRGVGMDAVRSAVEQIRGEVRATSSKGRGTRIILDVPLTQPNSPPPNSSRKLRSPS
jgi:chemotaxis protein histidine kinase CheA